MKKEEVVGFFCRFQLTINHSRQPPTRLTKIKRNILGEVLVEVKGDDTVIDRGVFGDRVGKHVFYILPEHNEAAVFVLSDCDISEPLVDSPLLDAFDTLAFDTLAFEHVLICHGSFLRGEGEGEGDCVEEGCVEEGMHD